MDGQRDHISYKTEWCIRKYADDVAFQKGEAFEVSPFEGNLLLNEGITALLNLLTGAAETAFNNANSYLGVGDSATAESATDTGLIATTNELYKAMEATYPQISGQGVTFRSVFASGDANWAWNEFTVANGNSDAADNLNRKTSTQGTKAAGQTWTLDLTITFS
jgi:hypothetical protein